MIFDKPAPPAMQADVVEIGDLGKERELRALRTRVSELEAQAVLRGDKIVTATRELENKQHTYKCGGRFHQQVTVCMDTPRVECSVCEAPLDPVEVLRDFVRHERTFVFEIESLRREKADLTAIVAALNKERTNARARVRRAGGNPTAIEEAVKWPRFKQPKKTDTP